MPMFQAFVWLDHHSAQVLQFDAEQVQSHTVKSHSHPTRQHGSELRDQHEFYAQVCDALVGIREILVTGGNSSLAGFKHCVDKHTPAMAPRVVGYEPGDHTSEKQLVALGRSYFLKADRMAGLPTPTST